MKDLYRRNRLNPYTSDRAAILNSDGLPEDIEAACAILLNPARKQEYDRCYAVLKIIAPARKTLGVSTSKDWRRSHQDFWLDPSVDDKGGISHSSRKSAPTKFSVKWALPLAVVIALVAVIGGRNVIDDQDASRGDNEERILSKQVLSSSAGVYEKPDDESKKLLELERYQQVDVVVTKSTAKWDYVKIKNVEGFVDNEALNIGNNEAADIAECEKIGTQRPANGELISALQQGSHQLKIVNPFQDDVLVKLKNLSGIDIVAFYMWGHQTTQYDFVPAGQYFLVYASGKRFSPVCGRFLADMIAIGENTQLDYSTKVFDDARTIEKVVILQRSGSDVYPIPPRLF